jgi:hypothetical protein
MTTLSNLPAIDELGSLNAQIAALTLRADEIKKGLYALDKGTYQGLVYEALVSHPETERVDWKAIAEKVGYSSQLKTAHTSTAVSHRALVKVRKDVQVSA